MGSKKRELVGSDLWGGKVKKKCCKSRPRCKRCPVVAMRLAKAQAHDLTGAELKKAVKRARAS